MKHFIIIQTTIKKVSKNADSVTNTTLANIVRQIKAENKEIAVSRFLLSTEYIKAIAKLDVECYDLSELSDVEIEIKIKNTQNG